MLQFPKILVNHMKLLATPTSLIVPDYLSQQTRNTFILKRRYPPRLHKRTSKPHRLKGKNFVYDLVEDTDMRRKEPLDLILTQYVSGLGNAGTRIKMHPEQAYVELLLPKLADYATPENIKKYSELADPEVTPFSSPTVEQTMKYLSQRRITMVMSRDIPWTLEKWHVRASFRKAGIYLSEDTITMPEKPISGPNLDIEGKEFYITLTINNREQVKVRCNIHHWASNRASHVYVEEFYKLPNEPIFPEDKLILDSLPPFWIEKRII